MDVLANTTTPSPSRYLEEVIDRAALRRSAQTRLDLVANLRENATLGVSTTLSARALHAGGGPAWIVHVYFTTCIVSFHQFSSILVRPGLVVTSTKPAASTGRDTFSTTEASCGRLGAFALEAFSGA